LATGALPDSSRETMHSRRKDMIVPTAVVLIAMATSAALLYVLFNQEEAKYRSFLSEQFTRRTAAVEFELEERRAIMPLLASLFAHLPADTPDWKRFDELRSLVPSHFSSYNLVHRTVLRDEEERQRFRDRLSPKELELTLRTELELSEGNETVYIPAVHIIDVADAPPLRLTLITYRNGLAQLPNTKRALWKAFNEGGVHEARVWDPELNAFISAEITPVYHGPTRPANAAPGAEHRAAVKGLISVAALGRNIVKNIFDRFNVIPGRLQITLPAGTVDGAPLEDGQHPIVDILFGEDKDLAEEYSITFPLHAPELNTTFHITPTRKHARAHIWANTAAIGLPIVVTIFGIGFGILQYSAQEQTRRAEESSALAESAFKSRSRFLSYLCHELRNPLNATKGFLEWLRDTLLTEEQVQDQPANQRQRPVNY